MKKHRDLSIRSYHFAKDVVLFIASCEIEKYNYPIISQLLRSSTSIGANIIEGRSGNSRKNMINFYSIALRSANETKYWLCLIRDTMSVDRTQVNLLLLESNELSKILAKSIIKLKGPKVEYESF